MSQKKFWSKKFGVQKNMGSKKIWVPKNVGSMLMIIFGSKETLIILFVYGILIYKVVGKSYCLLKLFRVGSGRVGWGVVGKHVVIMLSQFNWSFNCQLELSLATIYYGIIFDFTNQLQLLCPKTNFRNVSSTKNHKNFLMSITCSLLLLFAPWYLMLDMLY